jgi:hypothetical protein
MILFGHLHLWVYLSASRGRTDKEQLLISGPRVALVGCGKDGLGVGRASWNRPAFGFDYGRLFLCPLCNWMRLGNISHWNRYHTWAAGPIRHLSRSRCRQAPAQPGKYIHNYHTPL